MRIGITLTSSIEVGEKYLTLTKDVAKKIAKNGHGIVYGGTDYGMMGELAQSYLDARGNDLVGVMAKNLIDVTERYKVFPNLTESYLVETMEDRKNRMLELSDAYLILPGGYGTFEEIGVIAGGKLNKIFNKPICFLNYGGFYDNLLKFFDEMTRKRFSKINIRDACLVETDLNKIIEYFENYREVILPDKFVKSV